MDEYDMQGVWADQTTRAFEAFLRTIESLPEAKRGPHGLHYAALLVESAAFDLRRGSFTLGVTDLVLLADQLDARAITSLQEAVNAPEV